MNSKLLISRILIGFGALSILLYGYGAIMYGMRDFFGLLLFAVLPVGYGVILGKRYRKTAHVHMEKQILRLAAKQHNLLTAADVALYTSLNIEESGNALEDLRRKGFLGLKVADNGAFVYEFQSYLSTEEKLSAERI
ncbi:hypothetical protein GRF59_00375 [Paenibacillus sp. HJL G12]|uniref:Uncharacterized protein n=1 Tax=Paenibacillus dendrobii TaxID=2691084 RepID=A0A7X3IEM5_9BACL|nr:hypothetical protein [Paenibacillus dendrobii]MWV42071.1 hypothetical protein [Paenibacillus dendrobii]